MKMYIFRPTFHWSLFLVVELSIYITYQVFRRNSLVPGKVE